MNTEERLTKLEVQMAEYETLIAKLKAYAVLTPAGRMLLKILGAP